MTGTKGVRKSRTRSKGAGKVALAVVVKQELNVRDLAQEFLIKGYNNKPGKRISL